MKKITITTEDIRKANLIMQGKMERPKPVKFLPAYKIPAFVYDHEAVCLAFKRAFAKMYGTKETC